LALQASAFSLFAQALESPTVAVHVGDHVNVRQVAGVSTIDVVPLGHFTRPVPFGASSAQSCIICDGVRSTSFVEGSRPLLLQPVHRRVPSIINDRVYADVRSTALDSIESEARGSVLAVAKIKNP
jgi:hypothetical protein